MKIRNEPAPDAGLDEARPTDAHLQRYLRSYRLSTHEPSGFYVLWAEAMAHALLLEQDCGRVYPLHEGLTGLQMAEGARASARAFAFLLAEAPARNADHLESKIAVHEAMATDDNEMRRSRTASMVEAALQDDASELGIKLTKVAVSTGRH